MKEIQLNQQVQVAVPHQTPEDFLKKIAETYGTYQWPEDSIQCINPKNTSLVYIWGNRIKGSAEGSWNAKVDGTSKITVNKTEVAIQDGTSYGGSILPVEFELMVINDNQATPYWAKDFCKIGFEGDSFQSLQATDCRIINAEGDNIGNPLSSWMKNGNDISDNYLLTLAKDLSENAAMAYLALDIVPPEVMQHSMDLFKNIKFNSRDVSVSTRNKVVEDPMPVLIPFYLLEFQFEGKPYYFAMMADSQGRLLGELPPVTDYSKTPEEIVEEEMPEKVKQVNLVKWGWVIAIPLFIFVNLIVGAIGLFVWVVVYWFMKKPINNRIKELQKEKSVNSQKIADTLWKQLTL